MPDQGNSYFLYHSRMPKLTARLLLSWRSIAALTVIFFALLNLAGGPLFGPVENRWTLAENLKGMKKPAYPGVSAAAVGLSAEGSVIGAGGPGWGQWNFAAPGPLPSTVQPFFLPPEGSRSGVYLLTEGGARLPLIENTPLRNRALNFRDKVKGLRSFSVRFEGTGAVLSEVRFFQPQGTGGRGRALLLVLFCLALVFARGLAFREYHTAALALITAAGLLLRWPALYNYWDMPLEGDAASYWNYARSLKLAAPFANGTREPLFIWLLRFAEALFGDSERSSRFLTLIFSCSVIPMTWLLAKRLGLGAFACLAAAGLAALNPFSVFMSVQGYQLEFFTFLILLFSSLWLRSGLAASGAAGALLILTRVQSAAAVLPLAALAAWRLRGRLRGVLPYFIPPLAALAVLLASAKANTGSFTGNLDHAARAHTAIDRTGDPSRLKGTEDVTLGKYLFSGGAAPRLAARTLEGYFKILCDPFDPFNRIFLNSHYSKRWNLLLFPFLWAGLWAFFRDAAKREGLLLGLLFLSALPALHGQIREPRILFHAAPFFFVLCAAGFERGWEFIAALPRPPLPWASIKYKIYN